MTKIADIQILQDRCYIRLNECSAEEFQQVIDYRSWTHRSWTEGRVRKYFSFPYVNRDNQRILWCYVGFSPVLIRYLQSLGYMINGKELYRSREISVRTTLFQPYDFQQEAINAWIKNECVGIIKSPTGSGKSFLACKIIEQMKVKTLITVHTNDLFSVWFNTLTQQFGEDVKAQLGVIGGHLSKKDRKKMRIIDDVSYDSNIKQDIVIATSQSLLNRLDKLCNETFGLLIVDECHHYSSVQFNKVASHVKAAYRIGLSATTHRMDGTSPLFVGLLGDICYKITIRELVDKKVLVNPVFNTIIINDEPTQAKIATCGLVKLDLSRYVKQMSASSAVKARYVLNLVQSLCNNHKKFVLYTDFVNSKNKNIFTRDFYVAKLNDMGIKVIGVSADMTGNERSKIFTMLEKGTLNGIVFGLLGSEGVDIPTIDSVIMCNGTKSTIRYTQRVGRSMRIVKGDSIKCNAYIYEVLLNTPMELRWAEANFLEYEQENYIKEMIPVPN